MRNPVRLTDYRVRPGTRVHLSRISPDDTRALPSDSTLVASLIASNVDKLRKLQERLYAEHLHKVLFVFQAADTGGKDGVIRTICRGMDPAGVHVAAFKSPSKRELEHDPLWRVHQEAPRNGHIHIFNRSHYEDVIYPRIHGGLDARGAKRRMGHINDFERMLAEEGTTIVKFYLLISKAEQKKRLEARRDDPEKQWKLDPADLRDRKLWDEYERYYSEVLSATSTRHAYWYVVPANSKKIRDLIVSSIALQALKGLGITTPRPLMDVSGLEIV
jgi:PPK2 family polyphosphate:nucleotide phosphotransferase